MSWIQVILDFLRQFWPFEIVYSYQRGVRFWCGKDTAELPPGVHMFLPFFGRIECVNVRLDILRLENQNLTTQDGIALSVSANVGYEIHNARAAFVNVQQVLNNLADECRTALSNGIRNFTYEALLADQTALEEMCVTAIADAAEDWGVTISHVNLADFVRTKNLSLTKL